MKHTLPRITVAVYLTLLLSTMIPLARADFIVAYLVKDTTTAENSYTGSGVVRGGGACFFAPITAQVTTVIFAARASGSAGSDTPTGTMFARVYKATGNPTLSGPSGDCSGNQLLGTSDSINLNQLTTSMRNFTFTFSGTQRGSVRNGQGFIVAVFFDKTDGDPINTQVALASGTTGAPPLKEQHYVFTPDGGTTWNTGQPRCEAAGVGSGVCEAYTLSGISEDIPTTESPSPYGYNPPYFPCCSQVGPTALQGAALRAPNVDSLPFVYLFLIIFAVTLGPYLIFGRRRKTRQYEIAI